MNQRIITALVFCGLSVMTNLLSDIKGSQAVLSIEPHAKFVAYPIIPNVMETFGLFKNGFTLEAPSATAVFRSVYPVSGDINLNGGLLNLHTDLILRNPASLVSTGSIYGNGHSVELCAGVTNIPGNQMTVLSDLNLVMNAHLRLDGLCHIIGNVTIDGRGHSLSFGTNGCLSIAAGSTLIFENVILNNLTGMCLRPEAESSRIVFLNTQLQLVDTITIANGSLLFENNVSIVGTHEFQYTSTQLATIAPFARLTFERGSTFMYAPVSGKNNLLVFTDNSSQLLFNEATLHAASTGLCLDQGTILVDNHVRFLCDAQGDDDLGIEIKQNFTVCILGAGVLELLGCITLE